MGRGGIGCELSMKPLIEGKIGEIGESMYILGVILLSSSLSSLCLLSAFHLFPIAIPLQLFRQLNGICSIKSTKAI